MYLNSHTKNKNKHTDACNYLPPYKLGILKTVEYKFSCEMEAHVEVTTSKSSVSVYAQTCVNLRRNQAIYAHNIYLSIWRRSICKKKYRYFVYICSNSLFIPISNKNGRFPICLPVTAHALVLGIASNFHGRLFVHLSDR